jgi:hypothetical protein
MIPAEKLRDLYETQQLSVRQIADQLHSKHETVRLWLRRAGIQTRGKQEGKLLRSPYKNLWTPERDEIIRSMWDNSGTRAIAKKIGCGVTKNAIIGRARRLGLPPHAKRPLSMTADAVRLREKTKKQNREMSLAERVAIGSAVRDSKRYRHESLIAFPESPRLEMAWREMLAKVKRERGAAWDVLVTHR